MKTFRKLLSYFRKKETINNLHFNGGNSYIYFGNYGKRVDITIKNADIYFRIHFGIFNERLVYDYTTAMDYSDFITIKLKREKSQSSFLKNLKLNIVFKYINNNILMNLSEENLKNVVSCLNDNNVIYFSKNNGSFTHPAYNDVNIFNVRQFNFFKGEFPSDKHFNFFFEKGKLFRISDAFEFHKVKDFLEYPSKKVGASFKIIKSFETNASWTLISDDYECRIFFDSKDNKYYYTSKDNIVTCFDESSFSEIIYLFCIDVLRLNKNMLTINFLQFLKDSNIDLDTMTTDEYQTILMYEY